MENISININTWTEFKKYFDGTYKRLNLQYYKNNFGYYCFCIENQLIFSYQLWDINSNIKNLDKIQSDIDTNDFINNYKDYANKQINNYVYLRDFGSLDPEKYRSKEKWFDMPVVIGINPSILDISWQYTIAIEGAMSWMNHITYEKGDYINAIITPPNNGVIGSLTTNHAINDTIINVSSTVIDNILPGDYIYFGSDVNRYEVISIRSTDITISSGLIIANSISDYVILKMFSGENIDLQPNIANVLGYENFGSLEIPELSTLRIEYHHKTNPISTDIIKFGLLIKYGKFI